MFHVTSFRDLGAAPAFEWIINNGPVFTEGADPTRTVAENTVAGVNIGTPVSATDADGDTLTYTLSGNPDAVAFRIVSTTGQLQTKAALDYETQATYTVMITVSDGNGGSDMIALTIKVTDTNDAPIFAEGINATRSIAENTAAGQNIGTPVAATDDDADMLTYTLGGTDAASFSILSTTGQLRTRAALDYETKNAYAVTVSVSDGNDGTDSIAVTINVTDVRENRAPVFTEGTTTTRNVRENTASGQNIGGPIAATDADNDTLTYTLGGTDAASFRIVSTSGQLRTRASLNYERKSAYTVTVSVSDGKGGTDSITVTINVTDVNERPPNKAPVFTDGDSTTRTVPETMPSNRNIGRPIAATDANNDILTYTLGGRDAASFRMLSTTGQLRTSAALDYETKTSYTVTVSASDGKGGSDSITVTIKVTNVAELPNGMTPIRQRTPQVRDAIVTAAGVRSPDHVTAAHLAAITHLPIQRIGITALKSGDFDGLTALIELRIYDNSIRDISPLENLTSLTTLYMYGNGISDISPLKHLTNLTALTLSYNSISDISPLKNLTKLKSLSLHVNPLSDISPLENLTKLTWLKLNSTSISDVSPLKNLTELKSLTLSYNSISDISPLENLTKLTWLELNSTSISDVSPLKNLTELEFLYLHYNSISDISPLEDLTKLTWLKLRNNPISDYAHLRRLIAAIAVIEGHPGLTLDITIPAVASNNAPVFTDGTSTTRSVVENTAADTNIGTAVAATDADTADTLTYYLGGTDASSFRIVRTSGQLQTKAVLDYETQNAYTITVAVSDGNGGTDSITVTINVTDVVGSAPSVEIPPVIPENTELLTNFPNPFNPETWIPYQLAKPAEVTLTIYDIRGVVVRELKLGHQPAGVYTSRSRAIHWDGRNNRGEKVASGLYFYTLSTESTRNSLTAGDFNATRKLLIRK